MRKFLLLAVLTLQSLALAGEKPEKHSTVPTSPAWEKLKELAGTWDGFAMEGGKKMPTHLEIRLTADGSAVMHWMDAGTPHEMITMFHPDGKELMATHYCAAHNQPRMVLAPTSDAKQLAFDFKDGTNIGPGEGHMQRLVITFVDATHHREDWTYTGGPAMAFNYTRADKKPAGAK